jgi:ferritin-like metal-binding protein YciE
MGAEQMGNNPVMELLIQNLQQEKQTAQTVEQCLPQLLQQMMLVTQPIC